MLLSLQWGKEENSQLFLSPHISKHNSPKLYATSCDCLPFSLILLKSYRIFSAHVTSSVLVHTLI
jgi:hypothetical protein